jgi:enoyl-CoA hydratase
MTGIGSGLTNERRDKVAYLTLNRPDRLNALSSDLILALIEAFDEIHADPDVWAVLLTGEGDRAFCAGVDLKEVHDDGGASGPLARPMRGSHRNLFEVVAECSKPVVTALNGWAVGAGMELMLATDLVVAADHVQLAMPEAKRGMGGNFGAQRLARTLPAVRANQLLYLGEDISAETAAEWGLINDVVPREDLAASAEHLVRKVVGNAPLTIRRYKAAILRGRDLPLALALRLDVEPNPYTSEDRLEGVAAFIEKRPPVWKGK